ncbi:hypothetical protein ACDF64_09165 [Agromyces sp. MMS24-JH15]|uniref:hypothetical protein n=1 Tax=Agromyces sp. MMS24-JH15 TaxID=3243765 RepID=UPI003748FD59
MTGTLALSGCVTASEDGGRLSDWTTGIGAGWDRFMTEVLTPLGNALFAILVAWVAIAVVARLITLLPLIRNLRVSRRTGTLFRSIGWSLLVATPIVTVLTTAFATDRLVTWLAVSTPLAWLAAITLGIGLATRARLDAKVIAPSGESNEAWAIDALMQMRKVYPVILRRRVPEVGAPDLSEFITLADRSGSGIASAIAWVIQALFNATPWLLQVTIFDGRSAAATIRRNGMAIGEVELDLGRGDLDSDQHRNLLVLAAAFAASTMEGRYPDGGPAITTAWEPVGYRLVAARSTGEERQHYLARAKAAESAGIDPVIPALVEDS